MIVSPVHRENSATDLDWHTLRVIVKEAGTVSWDQSPVNPQTPACLVTVMAQKLASVRTLRQVESASRESTAQPAR